MTIQNRNKGIYKNNTSGYKGVRFKKGNNKFVANITIDGIQKHLGYFETAILAAIAYDTFVISNNLEHTLNGVIND